MNQIEPLPIRTVLAATGLDADFGDGGFAALAQRGSVAAGGRAVATLDDGSMILAAGFGSSLALAKADSAGNFIETFGNGGLAGVGDFAPDSGIELAAHPATGAIAIAGVMPSFSVGLRLLTPAGAANTAAGVNGLIEDPLLDNRQLERLAFAPDGTLYVAGRGTGMLAGQSFLAHYSADGALDTAFGAGGVLEVFEPLVDLEAGTTITSSDSRVFDMFVALDGDVHLFVQGEISTRNQFNEPEQFRQIVVIKLNPDGSPAAGFGDNGQVLIDSGSRFLDVPDTIVEAIDFDLRGDGVIVAVTNIPNRSFDVGNVSGDGYSVWEIENGVRSDKLRLAEPPDGISFRSFDLTPDGGLVALQSLLPDGAATQQLQVLRYRADRTLDPGWGENGVAAVDSTEFSLPLDLPSFRKQVVTDATGNALVAGTLSPGDLSRAAIARFDGTAAPAVRFLIVEGTAGRDNISVSSDQHRIVVAVNGRFARHARADFDAVQVLGGDGNDRVFATGATIPTYILGNAGHDSIRGGDGDDTISGGGGGDRIKGGDGDDMIVGGSGNDILIGLAGNDTLSGGAGKDRLYGNDGEDLLVGGRARDYLYGNAGDDRMRGGGSNDFFAGGDGVDTGDYDSALEQIVDMEFIF